MLSHKTFSSDICIAMYRCTYVVCIHINIYYILYCVYTWTYKSFINLYFICYCIAYLLSLIYMTLHITYPLYRLHQAIPKILYTYYLVIDVTLNIKEKLHTTFFPQVKETFSYIYRQR